MFPSKKSNEWFIVYAIYSFLILVSLLTTRVILGNIAWDEGLLGLIVLSLLSAVPAFLSGYFHKRLFFYVYSISIIIGLVYAFYVVIADAAPGWGDLTSIIGYMFMVVAGLVTAFFAETIYRLLHPSPRP